MIDNSNVAGTITVIVPRDVTVAGRCLGRHGAMCSAEPGLGSPRKRTWKQRGAATFAEPFGPDWDRLGAPTDRLMAPVIVGTALLVTGSAFLLDGLNINHPAQPGST